MCFMKHFSYLFFNTICNFIYSLIKVRYSATDLRITSSSVFGNIHCQFFNKTSCFSLSENHLFSFIRKAVQEERKICHLLDGFLVLTMARAVADQKQEPGILSASPMWWQERRYLKPPPAALPVHFSRGGGQWRGNWIPHTCKIHACPE